MKIAKCRTIAQGDIFSLFLSFLFTFLLSSLSTLSPPSSPDDILAMALVADKKGLVLARVSSNGYKDGAIDASFFYLVFTALKREAKAALFALVLHLPHFQRASQEN
jgi:hypothetical protein